MRRTFLRPLIICLVPTVLAAIFAGIGAYKEMNGQVGFRRGIDLAGGTILVYEVDSERYKEKNKDRELTNDDIKQLAEKLKKRIDPSDIKNVVVRPIGNSRVEIILPFAGSTTGSKESANEEFVQEVKNLVKQTGVLEFRILANTSDDKEAIGDVEKLLTDPSPEVKKQLEERAKAGKPPIVPDRMYDVKASGDTIQCRYEWIELGPEERETLEVSERFSDPNESKGYRKDPQPYNWMWGQLQQARTRGGIFLQQGSASKDRKQRYTYLLYSRDFVKQGRTKDDEGKKVEYFALTRVSEVDTLQVSGEVRLQNLRVTDDQDGKPAVGFGFNAEGARKFGAMNERNKPLEGMVRNLAIVMDDKLVSAPSLNAILREGGIISGNMQIGEVTKMVNILRSGNLNAELKPDPVSENTVGATLGQTTIRKGLWSVAGAFAAVLLFMVYYYRFSGLVACIALFANLLLTVGFMVAVQAAFTLPGLAGLVLMLGMAVDANVLIYERLREEREKGATLMAAIRNGYDRALPTIIDTHLTSIFTAIVLYMFGNDSLKGFSIALTVGLIISLFTSLYMTRLIFDYSIHRRWVTQLTMHKLFGRPKFDFMKIRKQMLALTAFLTVAGLFLVAHRDKKILNVDFTQGTVYGGRLTDGQERALGTSGGKLGLVELIGEDRQKSKLKVKDNGIVSMASIISIDAEADSKAATQNIYKILYEDGSEAIVTLANLPEGNTPAEQIANLKERASTLPSASVEQVYLRGDATKLSGGKSLSFTVRTTEKEAELVQVTLDRLLRDETTNEPLLASTKVTNVKIDGPIVTLTFDKPTLPSYFRTFLVRALQLGERWPGTTSNNLESISVKGVKSENAETATEETRSNRYTTIQVDLSQNPKFASFKNPATAKPEDKTKDTEKLTEILNEAKKSFESRPLPDRVETFDPALAKDTRSKAFLAVLMSWVAVLAFLWFRFGSWQFGLAAVICLIHDLCFTLGAIAVCHYVHDTTIGHFLGLQDFKIDLAAVAALLTLVGYSVNDTIVVFDRIREVRGKSPLLTAQMINDSVNQTLSRTVLAALTVFLVVVVLYIFGGEGVHLFAFVMVMGVIVGTYSSIYIAAPLLLIFGEGKTKPGQVVSDKPTASELAATQASAATS